MERRRDGTGVNGQEQVAGMRSSRELGNAGVFNGPFPTGETGGHADGNHGSDPRFPSSHLPTSTSTSTVSVM